MIGDITGDTFNVNTPNADVIDQTTGGTINVVDADNNSYHYNGTSSIVWKDTNGGRFVNDKDTPVDITIGAGTNVTLNGKLGVVTAEGNATITLQPETIVAELEVAAGTVTVNAPAGAIELQTGEGAVTPEAGSGYETELNLAAAKTLAGSKESAEYTVASWTTLSQALALAESTVDEMNAKTSAINAAVSDLVTVAQEITHSLNLDGDSMSSSIVQFGSNGLEIPSFLTGVEAGNYEFKLVFDQAQSDSLTAYYNNTKKDSSWTEGTTPDWFTYLLGTVPTAADDADVNAMFEMKVDETGVIIQDGTQLNSGDGLGADAGMIIPNDFPAGVYKFVGTVGEFHIVVEVTINQQ